MGWRYSLPMSNAFLVTIFLCLLLQVDGRIRRRRQYTYTNYGSVGLNPEVISYYGMSGAGRFTGNDPETNRFVVGGIAYQYPTPVNVMSGGQYDPQKYNVYPSGGDAYHYDNINNMRLPSPYGWYPTGYLTGYPFLPFLNSARRATDASMMVKLFLSLTALLICVYNQ